MFVQLVTHQEKPVSRFVLYVMVLKVFNQNTLQIPFARTLSCEKCAKISCARGYGSIMTIHVGQTKETKRLVFNPCRDIGMRIS